MIAAPSAKVWAIPASNNYSQPSAETFHDQQTLPDGLQGWAIGAVDNRIGVTLDPTAGPWIKNLLGPNGGNVSADDTGFTAPSSYALDEHLVIGGQLSWTDWHEDVLTPGWNIGALISANGGPVHGLVVDLTDTNWPTTGGTVSMTFDPLPPGTRIDLKKTLSWVGDPKVIGNLFNGVIRIAEYPTPEPGSAVLFGLGIVGLLLLRRKLAG
jgi:hypothetical protein